MNYDKILIQYYDYLKITQSEAIVILLKNFESHYQIKRFMVWLKNDVGIGQETEKKLFEDLKNVVK